MKIPVALCKPSKERCKDCCSKIEIIILEEFTRIEDKYAVINEAGNIINMGFTLFMYLYVAIKIIT